MAVNSKNPTPMACSCDSTEAQVNEQIKLLSMATIGLIVLLLASEAMIGRTAAE